MSLLTGEDELRDEERRQNQGMYLLANGKLGTAEDKIKELTEQREEWKEKFKTLDRELKAELRDPNGTIWEHAASLQKQVDKAAKLLGHVMAEDLARRIIEEK